MSKCCAIVDACSSGSFLAPSFIRQGFTCIHIQYSKQVLDALGVRNGPSHSEVMMTSRGPVLIECGARVMGGMFGPYFNTAVGYNQIDQTVIVYTSLTAFQKMLCQVYSPVKQLQYVILITQKEGTLRGFSYLENLRRLKSFLDILLYVQPGEKLRKTVDFPSSPGFVTLCHHDPEVIKNDYQYIRNLEKQELFIVEKSLTSTN